jgi:hypothetical protein
MGAEGDEDANELDEDGEDGEHSGDEVEEANASGGEEAEAEGEDVWEEMSSAMPSASFNDGFSNATCKSSASDAFFDQVLRNSDALASVFRTPRDEIVRVQDAARDLGLHWGMIHRPRGPPSPGCKRPPPSPLRQTTTRTTTPPPRGLRQSPSDLKRDSSWWMVIGKNGEAVNHLLEMQDRATTSRETVMPGHIGSDSELAYTPRLASFMHLALSGAFGGLAVVYGLAWLQQRS